MSTNKYSSDDIFNKWLGGLNRENITEKYKYSERKRYIQDLADLLKSGGVDFDEAKILRTQVLNTLTTREGRKGSGKYKDWKNNVLNDFDQIIADTYIDLDKNVDSDSDIKIDAATIEIDELIKEWVLKKYDGNEYIMKKAHDPSSFIYIEFIKDTFGDYVV